MNGDGIVFDGFGDSILVPAVRRPVQQVALKRELDASRRLVRQFVPLDPGIYGWLDKRQRLIYVGKSKSLRTRLSSYFAAEPADPKMARIRRASSRLVWEPISHELLALIREQELIFRWRPLFNRQGQPQRRQPGFVCLSGGPAPRAYMAFQRTAKADRAFGPILGIGQLREAVDCLNYVFGLRNCPDRVRMYVSPQLPLLTDLRNADCMRFELGSCLGPCAGGCSPATYQNAVDAACRFLQGDDQSVLKRLKGELAEAAEKLAFEKAAVVHRQWQALNWLSNKLRHWRGAREKIDGTYPVSTFNDRPLYLVFRQGMLAGYSDQPRARRVIKPLSLKRMERDDDALEMEIFLIVSAWFKKHADQTGLVQRAVATAPGPGGRGRPVQSLGGTAQARTETAWARRESA
jgi:excinuclease ABC subunit C